MNEQVDEIRTFQRVVNAELDIAYGQSTHTPSAGVEPNTNSQRPMGTLRHACPLESSLTRALKQASRAE